MNSRIKKILYLPIETVSREMDAKLLLSVKAIDSGYTVFIGSKGRVKTLANIIKHGIWIDKGHGDHYMSERLNSLIKSNIVCAAFDEEALAIVSPEIYLNHRNIRSGAALNSIHCVFAWGDYQAKVMEPLVKDNSKVCISGSLRFDLLKKPYCEIYNQKILEIKKTYGQFILINTNFHPWNNSGRAKGYIEKRRRAGAISTNSDEIFYLNRVRYTRRLFHHYASSAIALSRAFPDLSILIRPHPSECLETWLETVKGYNNLHVVRDGNVHPWILASECVIHTGCTTGLEAFVAGKPVVKFHPIFKKEYESSIANSVGVPIYCSKALIDQVKLNMEAGSKEKKISGDDESLQYYLFNTKENNAVTVMLERINELNKICQFKRFSVIRYSLGLAFLHMLKIREQLSLKRVLLNVNGVNEFTKFPPFNKGQVLNSVMQINKVCASTSKIRISIFSSYALVFSGRKTWMNRVVDFMKL